MKVIIENFSIIKKKKLGNTQRSLKKKLTKIPHVSFFNFHSGLFSGFKSWYVFHNIKLSGEAESANEEAAKTFYPGLKQKTILL